MSLLEALASVPEYRKPKGRRHPVYVLLVFIVMGNLAGYRGNRPLAKFSQRYGHQVAELLGLEVEVLPSYSTFRRAYLSLDFTALSDAFAQWMAQNMSPDEDCYAIDGKRINQPLMAEDGKTRFAGLVSVFAQNQGVTVEMEALTQQENSEIKVVQYLLEKLQLTGAILSLDSLHAQKNTPFNS